MAAKFRIHNHMSRLLPKENFREPFGLPKLKGGSPSHIFRRPKLILRYQPSINPHRLRLHLVPPVPPSASKIASFFFNPLTLWSFLEKKTRFLDILTFFRLDFGLISFNLVENESATQQLAILATSIAVFLHSGSGMR